jgi:hypothetical protein
MTAAATRIDARFVSGIPGARRTIPAFFDRHDFCQRRAKMEGSILVARGLFARGAGAVGLCFVVACGSSRHGGSPSDAGASTSSSSGSSSGSGASGSSSSGSSGSGSGSLPPSDGGIFDHCSLDGGCLAECTPPANDPIGTGNADYDLYDGCILAAMQIAGLTETWQGQLLKAQAMNESGITPVITTNDNMCGGQNCGIWAISAGRSSSDSPPGPCGSSMTDPATNQVDYSHSYGIFQSTPACEGTFLPPTLPAGYKCTPTGTVDNIPFGADVTFYCESATTLGTNTAGGVKGYINAVQKTSDPYYATSVFNPAYQLLVYIAHSWAVNFKEANAMASGCTIYQQWYLSLAYWLTGSATTTCSLTGAGLQYANNAIENYKMLYGKAWPYPGP